MPRYPQRKCTSFLSEKKPVARLSMMGVKKEGKDEREEKKKRSSPRIWRVKFLDSLRYCQGEKKLSQGRRGHDRFQKKKNLFAHDVDAC